MTHHRDSVAEQLTESLRSMPKDKPFSISFALPGAMQTSQEEIVEELRQHLEQTTGSKIHVSAVDMRAVVWCASFGPLTSLYAAQMMIMQKAMEVEVQEFEPKVNQEMRAHWETRVLDLQEQLKEAQNA